MAMKGFDVESKNPIQNTTGFVTVGHSSSQCAEEKLARHRQIFYFLARKRRVMQMNK